MNEFTSSNGVTLGHSPEGHILLPASVMGLGEVTQQALREFFQAEADERLGRWRWPEEPKYVVYPRLGHVVAINEKSGNALRVTRAQASSSFGLARAARAYFEAHPEPKPWHDAKPGEVWVISWGASYVDVPARVVESDHFKQRLGFVPADTDIHDIGVFAPDITAARRIWPEVSE